MMQVSHAPELYSGSGQAGGGVVQFQFVHRLSFALYAKALPAVRQLEAVG